MTPRLIVLGSSNAVPDAYHENTHMLIQAGQRSILVDCSGSPVARFERAGLDPLAVTDIIITHFHPDHAGGLPVLLMDLWLMGRKAPLTVHGLPYTLQRVIAMMELYAWKTWPGFYPIEFAEFEQMENATVLDDPAIFISASPVEHFLPNAGLRMEFRESNQVLAYSCDTEPCESIDRLIQGVDVLIHEATGAIEGHCSAGQAGDAAMRAGVGSLVLIHYKTGRFANGDLVAQAKETYRGNVTLAEDFMALDFTPEGMQVSSVKK